jgi:hypothetical protein
MSRLLFTLFAIGLTIGAHVADLSPSHRFNDRWPRSPNSIPVRHELGAEIRVYGGSSRGGNQERETTYR